MLAGAMGVLLATLWLVLHEPWLGLNFADTPDPEASLVIESADAGARMSGLREGDRVRAIRAAGQTFGIPGGWLVETPSYFIRYADYNEFLAQQARLHGLLRQSPVEVLREDGAAFRLEAQERPLAELPAAFWLQIVYALLALSVGTVLIAFRPTDTAARWFAVCSFGFFVGTMMRALYGSRALVIDADVLRAALAVAHAGALLATAALASFAWHFPRRLANFPASAALMAFAVTAWFFDTLQLLPTTNLAYRGPMLLMFIPVLGFSIAQYWTARNDPVRRAVARWLLLVLIAGPATVGAGMLMVSMGQVPEIPRGTQGLSTVLLMYLGMVVLILRQRAFDLERWWFEAWVWFLGGALVIGFDLLLVYALSLKKATAIALSLATIGWVYFPFRQWLLARLWHRPQRDLRELFPQLVGILLAPAEGVPSLDERWRALLAHVFEPRTIGAIESNPATVCIEQSGLRLLVPQAAGAGAITLDYADGGARLFSRHDVRLAQSLLDLLRQGVTLQEAYGRGAAHERSRIARDLHDDIGARLLTLVHETGSERAASLARKALADMRDIVAGLRARPLALDDALADWRAELTQRAGAAGCAVAWHQPEFIPQVLLSPRQQINLARILREATSNALRHACPTHVNVDARINDVQIRLSLRHDGTFAPTAHWLAGMGLASMRRRTAELGGSIQWQSDGAELVVEIGIPLNADVAA